MAFRPNATSVVLLVVAFLVSGHAVAEPDQGERVRKFVTQSSGSVPFEEARTFKSSDVPTLLSMLADKNQEKFWPNVVRTLGIIGDAKACAPMIVLLEQDVEGELSSAYYLAKTGVLFSLAYVVERDKNATRALDYLINSTDPAVWTQRGLKWKDPYHPSPKDRDRHLSKIAILALGLTGNSRSSAALKEPKNPGAREFLKHNRDVVQTALAAYKTVTEVGLVGYYREQEAEPQKPRTP